MQRVLKTERLPDGPVARLGQSAQQSAFAFKVLRVALLVSTQAARVRAPLNALPSAPNPTPEEERRSKPIGDSKAYLVSALG